MDVAAPVMRDQYPHLQGITTRWSDNDVYGHVNNVVYFSYFDTVVNQYLIEHRVLDIHGRGVIGLVVENTCRYFESIQFPDRVAAGMQVRHLGTSSVIYQIGLFRNDQSAPAAQGRFVHVYVDRDNRRPVPLPPELRTALAPLVRQ
ncbi:MAG TPA: thioesterase family protein [Lautropia sp.]|jgi:acyl-CoA thioester hydrolase|nr:thioesterase family protein [Lautropia sp.]